MLTNYISDIIYVHYVDGAYEDLFQNKAAKIFMEARPEAGNRIKEKISRQAAGMAEETVIWTLELPPDREQNISMFFSVESYPVFWNNRKAVFHILTDETERKRQEQVMYRLAYADPLTGLNNRRYAMEKMKRWIERKVPFVLSFIDLDFLKHCNDTYGHQAGDVYLTEVAEMISSTVEGELCRIGGDEFYLICEGIQAEEQDKCLEEVRNSIMTKGTKHGMLFGFSYASCEVPVNPEKDLKDYIDLADDRMYQYKKANRATLADFRCQDNRIDDNLLS
jgi:diguanylate cyclase (GGDEF)-like protein